MHPSRVRGLLDSLAVVSQISRELRWHTESALRDAARLPRASRLRLALTLPIEVSSPRAAVLRAAVAQAGRDPRIRIATGDIEQPADDALLFRMELDGQVRLALLDGSPTAQLAAPHLAGNTSYFKVQLDSGGNGANGVFPAGQFPSSPSCYEWLHRLRTESDEGVGRYDVYAPDCSPELQQRLQRQLRFKVLTPKASWRYSEHLRRMTQSKIVLLATPSDRLSPTLVEALAIGRCVVTTQPAVRLPSPLLDGKHVVFVRDDGSDVVARCEQLLGDTPMRYRVGRSGRAFFDQHLHPTSLVEYFARCAFREASSEPQTFSEAVSA